MKKTTQTQLIEGVKNRPLYIASFLIGAKVGGVTLAGFPDAIVFQQGKPAFVIELKTAKGPLMLWKDQEVQAKMYALLLDSMGFDCSSLKIIIAKIRRRVELEEEPKKAFLAVLIKASLDRADARQALRAALGGEAEIFTFSHDRNNIMRELYWAKQYWLGKRDPIPTNSPGRCRACEFNTTCPASLA